MMVKLLLIFGILAALFVWSYRYLGDADTSALSGDDSSYTESRSSYESDISDETKSVLIPDHNSAEVVEHTHYLLGYNERHEQADWVSYILTKESLKIPNVPRAKRFNEDPAVSTRSVRHSDYTRSGYSRGHLVPAGDMAFNKEAMQETFYMSNMSPQLSGFNGGIWKELEESVRDWAYKYDELYVASGPIFSGVTKSIGRSSKIRVPDAFYKVILDVYGRRQEGIGYIIPHEISEEPLSAYAVTIDEVEAATGLDFFSGAYANTSTEKEIESSKDVDYWPTSQKRFNNRINNWNHN